VRQAESSGRFFYYHYFCDSLIASHNLGQILITSERQLELTGNRRYDAFEATRWGRRVTPDGAFLLLYLELTRQVCKLLKNQ
jgi:hypothetical protein